MGRSDNVEAGLSAGNVISVPNGHRSYRRMDNVEYRALASYIRRMMAEYNLPFLLVRTTYSK